MSEADLKSPERWTRRPLFSPSQTLTAQQLNVLMEEQRAHGEMLMRALHGHGVIFGYAVSPGERQAPKEKCEAGWIHVGSTELEISCGMALDRHGRLLRWPKGTLRYEDVVGRRKDCPGTHTLSVHYAERRIPKGGCGPCGEQPEWIEDGVVFALACGCEDADRACPAARPGTCVSWDEYVCSRTASGSGKLPVPADLAAACEGPGELCRIDCSDVRYDPHAGIPVACVKVADIAVPGCPERWGFSELGETCAVRPHVYRTPLLYELVRGCQDNLARVESLSWEDWLVDDARCEWEDETDWEALKKLFEDPEGLTIEFTKPIRVKTVHPSSVFLTTRYWEPGDNYILLRRIPADLQPLSEGKLAKKFRLIPYSEWVTGEFDNHATLRNGGTIELTIRGQMLRDECGNMLNAAPLFYQPASPEQACPGGDFVAAFNFGPAPADYGKRYSEPVKGPDRPRRRPR